MNKKLLIAIISIFSISHGAIAQPAMSPSVSVQIVVEDWCNAGTGSLDAQVFGGTPPYTYQWNTGAVTEIADGLFSGFYDVTVTDNLGITAVGSGYVGSISAPEFYAISVEMPRNGLNNGAVVVAIYPDQGGGAVQIPNGPYYYYLLDSTGAIIETYSFIIPGTIDPYYTFDSLPAGSYSVQCNLPMLGCYTYCNFVLKNMHSISPTFTSLPSCNGAPTGQIVVNTHPAPAINSTTFKCNLSSNLVVMDDIVTSKYKAIIYNSNNLIYKYYRTRDSVFTINGMLPGNYTLKIYAGDTVENFYPGSHDSTLFYTGNFTIANDTLCSLVKGQLFADYNSNCTYNTGDINLAGTLIELNPGGLSSVTNSTGEFYIPAPVGVYTLKQYAPYQYAQLCPDTNTFTINVSSTGMIINVPVADSVNVNPDVQLGMFASPPRPGFNQSITLTYGNLTPGLVASQLLTLNYNTNLTYVNSSPAFNSSTSGQLTWNTPALGPFSHVTYHVTLNVPASTVIGTQLQTSANVTTVALETNTANNSDSITQTVTGSYDPNDIAVDPVGYDSPGYITNSENLKYTIRFQNTGTDTAFTVVVADTLPSTLNKYSLQVTSASHPYWYEFKTPNVVLFHFDNILLPDSNVNEEASHGFIKFSISQASGNIAGTQINCNAAIYFDYNTPVITNTVSNTIFDCNQMATATINNSTICMGDTIAASSTVLFNMNKDWFVDGLFYSNDSSIVLTNLTAGLHEIKFIASNPSCAQQLILNATVNALPAKPLITQIGWVLSSSSLSGNQWIVNGSIITGATDTVYSVTSNGWYSVLVTDANGCSSLSDSIFVLVGGLINTQNEIAITLKPNPANDKVQIDFDKNVSVTSISVCDLFGKEIINEQFNSSIKSTMLNIEVLKPGVYFVKVKVAEKISTMKLLKLKD